MAFWLSVIIALAPIDPAPPKSVVATEAGFSAALSDEAVGVARATVSDVASFCDRNPEACETGTRVLDRFGAKAIAVAGYLFDVVSGARETRKPNPERAQPVAAPQASPKVPGTQNTLEPGDLDAPWVGPVDSDA